MLKAIFLISLFVSSVASAQIPARPILPDHPASSSYGYGVQRENLNLNGRVVNIFWPRDQRGSGKKFPVLVFGHGQAIDVNGYDLSFEHMAKKGVVVIHPAYDSGFFDQDWRRMADDFNSLTEQVLQKYPDLIDERKIVYSGHSKGAYVALMAAGAPKVPQGLQSVILFAPAGYDSEYLKTIDPDVPVTLVWSDADTVIKQSIVTEIYAKLPSISKQWILMKSYPTLKADHFFPLNRSYFFGGQNGLTAHHYYGFWKWILGAVLDVEEGGGLQNPYLYGSEASSTGVDSLKHSLTRSWVQNP